MPLCCLDRRSTLAHLRECPTKRAVRLVQIDDLAIRGECAVEFNLDCILLTGGLVDTSDTSALKTLAFCGSTVNTSGYALRYLW
jgi:hypothetical protein